MDVNRLEKANILAKSLIPKTDELLALSPKSSTIRIFNALNGLSELDPEFKTKFNKLLYETKQKFQKEFDEL